MKGLQQLLTTPEMQQKISLFFMVCLFILYCPLPVFCAPSNGLGKMALTLRMQTDEIAGMVKKIALLTGFVFISMSIITFANMKKTQTPLGIPIAMLIAGIILVSIVPFIGVGTESFFETKGTEGLNELLLN
jgi:hypothetical protein